VAGIAGDLLFLLTIDVPLKRVFLPCEGYNAPA
jgi:hypothetical protein